MLQIKIGKDRAQGPQRSVHTMDMYDIYSYSILSLIGVEILRTSKDIKNGLIGGSFLHPLKVGLVCKIKRETSVLERLPIGTIYHTEKDISKKYLKHPLLMRALGPLDKLISIYVRHFRKK